MGAPPVDVVASAAPRRWSGTDIFDDGTGARPKWIAPVRSQGKGLRGFWDGGMAPARL
ncbi:hypothetical protein [Palleronia rufa]|uniref:hypothetical protein n=1 Tax=Palleronia rufa TaxID=1530186 RepID=UPI0013765F34|nr:hypothetical protein [Palleronia rufa]